MFAWELDVLAATAAATDALFVMTWLDVAGFVLVDEDVLSPLLVGDDEEEEFEEVD